MSKRYKRSLKRKDRRRERAFEERHAHAWLTGEALQQGRRRAFENSLILQAIDAIDEQYDEDWDVEYEEQHLYDIDDYYDDRRRDEFDELYYARIDCPQCNVSNEGDASYCKRCGGSMFSVQRAG